MVLFYFFGCTKQSDGGERNVASWAPKKEVTVLRWVPRFESAAPLTKPKQALFIITHCSYLQREEKNRAFGIGGACRFDRMLLSRMLLPWALLNRGNHCSLLPLALRIGWLSVADFVFGLQYRGLRNSPTGLFIRRLIPR